VEFFVRLWWLFVSIVSLGFYVRVPNVIVVTEPMHSASSPNDPV
jgi:hypothetical protein